jgi:cytochrome c oxidase assembly protein subunit 15
VAVQSTVDPRAERFTIGEDRYRIIAYAALATLTLIIWTGAAVRLTGSGLGCAHWPNCEAGHLLPPLSGHALIEFGNRMVTGVVGLPCILAAVGAFRLRPFRRDLVVPACILPLGVAAQAVLGGITVLLDLSWEVVIVHYLLSAALLVSGVVLVWRLRRGADTPQEINPRGAVLGTRALVVFGWLIIVAGTFATAAGPHAGGAGTGDYVARLDALGTDTLRQLIHLHGHAAAVMGFASIALFFFARHLRVKPLLLGGLATVCVAMGIQGTVGLIQYHDALPSWLVWIHASLAALVWIVLVFSWLAAGAPRRA